ncbi:MAG: DUF4272 domain-containing protein [Myxococcales bacterium]|nr:DUF4272 domain-containing protein [Myxococcales bacterium]
MASRRSASALTLGFLLVIGCDRKDVVVPQRPPEHPAPSAEALARKKRSEEKVTALGLRLNASLPVIESVAEAKPRAKDAIVDRALALSVVALASEDDATPQLVGKVRMDLAVDPFLSPKEKRFLDDPAPSPKERAYFNWQYECLGVLLWALGLYDLPPMDKVVDAGQLTKIVREKQPKGLRADGKLRAIEAVLDEADLIYRIDWACVDARVKGSDKPKSVDCEVVVERHRALNWLIGYNGQAWDDVSTDT